MGDVRIKTPLVIAAIASLSLVSTAAAQSDHYKCYRSKQIAPPFTPVSGVTLVDQFESTTETIRRPDQFCNPVAKDGGGIGIAAPINDPTAHLNCYRTKRAPGTPKFQKQIIDVENQFGPQTLLLNKPHSLCVPAEKDMVPSALEINHFKCYRAKTARGTPKFEQQVVTLEDQFETKDTTVKKPYVFCNPVDKNGEGIEDPTNHLTCYKIRRVASESKFPGRSVVVSDQFGDLGVTAKLGHSGMLCVPTIKEGAPTPTPSPTPTPTPAPTATAAPTPTPPYGSASQAFVLRAATLLR